MSFISFMVPTTTALTVFKATLNTQSKDLSSKNKNSNENNSTLRKAGVDATTSHGVPKATAPSGEVEREDTRPSPPGLSPEGANPLSQDKDRDARAYEHERHRVKHSREWAKRRARKATKGLIGDAGIGRAGATHAERRAKSRKGGLDVDVDVYAVNPQGHTDRLAAELQNKASLSRSGDGGYNASKAIPGVNLNLSEIIVLSQRKPRKLNVDDFEVIPHIRSVIALDDAVNEHDIDLDESWEHIYVNNGEGKASDGKLGRLSYARVAGTGCQ